MPEQTRLNESLHRPRYEKSLNFRCEHQAQSYSVTAGSSHKWANRAPLSFTTYLCVHSPLPLLQGTLSFIPLVLRNPSAYIAFTTISSLHRQTHKSSEQTSYVTPVHCLRLSLRFQQCAKGKQTSEGARTRPLEKRRYEYSPYGFF